MTRVPVVFFALTGLAVAGSRGEILDFSATWCGPCQNMKPLVHKLQAEGHPIRVIDVDREPETSQKFRVKAMPTFVLLVDGHEVERHVGGMSEGQLRTWLKKIPAESPDVARGSESEGAGSPVRYVADPNVRLGNPAPISTAFEDRESLDATRSLVREQPGASVPGGFPEDALETAVLDEPPPTVRANDSPMAESQAAAGGAKAASPMDASVRLKVTVNGHINSGSGTIVSSEPGIARIITCGHIFRGFNESSRIEVHLFLNGRVESVLGRLVASDLEADVGLVEIPTEHVLPVAPVARASSAATKGEALVSIGCSGGADPTREEVSVTDVNPFVGPETLECTGLPVQGRSGGGLFNARGEVVGVCIAADEKRHRGIYAGLKPVHDVLAEGGLQRLYEPQSTLASAPERPLPPAGERAPAPQRPAESESLLDHLRPAAEESISSAGGTELFARETESVAMAEQPTREAPRPSASSTLSADELAHATDAEVVCIIRPRNQPEAPSQVVIIHQASPKLVSYLRGEIAPVGTTDQALSRAARQPQCDQLPRCWAVTAARPSETAESTLTPTSYRAPAQPRRYVRGAASKFYSR